MFPHDGKTLTKIIKIFMPLQRGTLLKTDSLNLFECSLSQHVEQRFQTLWNQITFRLLSVTFNLFVKKN